MVSEKYRERFLPPLWILTIFSAAVLIWLLIELKDLVTLLVASYAIAFIMNPLLNQLEERAGVPRSRGCLVLYGVAIIMFLLPVITFGPTLMDQFDHLRNNWTNYLNLGITRGHELLNDLNKHLPSRLEHAVRPLPEPETPPLTQLVNAGAVSGLMNGLWAALLQGYSVTMFLFNLVLLPFMVYYIAVDFDNLHQTFLAIFPGHMRKSVVRIAQEINVLVSAFVRGQFIVCCIMFVLYFAGMLAIGLEAALLLAVIAGFGNLVPYLGLIMGVSLSSLIALVTYGDLSHLLMVLGLFLGVQSLEGTFITPRIMGERVGISPLVVILAIFANGKLFGLLGIFLAVPIAAIVKVLGAHLRGWVIERTR